jgi:hypothetical protein
MRGGVTALQSISTRPPSFQHKSNFLLLLSPRPHWHVMHRLPAASRDPMLICALLVSALDSVQVGSIGAVRGGQCRHVRPGGGRVFGEGGWWPHSEMGVWLQGSWLAWTWPPRARNGGALPTQCGYSRHIAGYRSPSWVSSPSVATFEAPQSSVHYQTQLSCTPTGSLSGNSSVSLRQPWHHLGAPTLIPTMDEIHMDGCPVAEGASSSGRARARRMLNAAVIMILMQREQTG